MELVESRAFFGEMWWNEKLDFRARDLRRAECLKSGGRSWPLQVVGFPSLPRVGFPMRDVRFANRDAKEKSTFRGKAKGVKLLRDGLLGRF